MTWVFSNIKYNPPPQTHSFQLLPLYTFVSVDLSKPGTQKEVMKMKREKYNEQKHNIHQWYKNNVHHTHDHS